MGKRKYALLLSVVLLSGCYGGNDQKLPPSNTQSHGATLDAIQQENVEIAEAKREIHKKRVQQIVVQEAKQYWDVPIGHDLQDYISKLCLKYRVDERLAYAVMKTESNFDPSKISDTNDYGLFQVNQINFDDLEKNLGITNFLDPYQNAEAGIYMIGQLNRKYHTYNEILISYNEGIGGMENLASRGEFETDYSRKVLKAMDELHKEVNN